MEVYYGNKCTEFLFASFTVFSLLYLRVTQTSHQVPTGSVESNTYPIIYLIDISNTQVYLGR